LWEKKNWRNIRKRSCLLYRFQRSDKVCQWLVTGRWFSPGILVSSTNKTDHHDITEILLKVVLNTINLQPYLVINCNRIATPIAIIYDTMIGHNV
jgi:hypothetical protein